MVYYLALALSVVHGILAFVIVLTLFGAFSASRDGERVDRWTVITLIALFAVCWLSAFVLWRTHPLAG